MPVITLSKFDVSGLSDRAMEVMRTAVLHAEKNRLIQLHRMRIETFCQMAGLPPMPSANFWLLLREASKVLVIVENIDTNNKCRDFPAHSWPLFNGVWVDGEEVIFEICNRTFDEGLLAVLTNLRPYRWRTCQGRPR